MENDLKERVDNVNNKKVVIDFENIGKITGRLSIEKDSIYFYFNKVALSAIPINSKNPFEKYVKYIGVYLDNEITFISIIKGIYLDSKCIYQKDYKIETIDKKDDLNVSSSLMNSIWEQRRYDMVNAFTMKIMSQETLLHRNTTPEEVVDKALKLTNIIIEKLKK